MKYSAIYSTKVNLDLFDEIIIQYDKQDKSLPTFLEEHSDKHIVLSIADVDDFINSNQTIRLNAIFEKQPNFSIRFYEFCEMAPIDDLLQQCIEELRVPYFFGFKVSNFDQLHYLLEQGACAVYLTENICFDLVRAKALCSEHGAQIRVFPNVAQASVRQSPAHKKFFVRPEDVETYSDVIDILEFFGPTDRQNILHKIYTKGVWFGDLNDLILDLGIEFDSREIIPGFAAARKQCQRRCMRGERCTICDRVLSISKKLKEKEVYINYQKNN